jgi:SH3 domain-containing YSC84-like protein 1
MQHSWWKLVQTGAASAVNGRETSTPRITSDSIRLRTVRRRPISKVGEVMRRLTRIAVIFLIVSAWADSGDKERDRITASTNVVKDIFNAPDKGVPLSVLDGTKCVIVIPDLKKAAFIVGGDYGRGVMTCRTGEDFKGPWSPPIMMASGGGDIGFQLGVEGTDVVILVLNDDGARSIMRSKVKLGAEASVAAGPVGRTTEASTNEAMKAQMLSYSRSRGLFAGVSVSGMTLRVDGDANENLYGEKVSAQQILKGEGITMPDEAKPLIAALKQATAKAAEQNK